MSRSLWKPIYLNPNILLNNSTTQTKELMFLNRNIYITKNMIGLEVNVYNGIRFFPFVIDNDKVGHCFGEFSPTRKKPIHPSHKLKKTKK